MNRLNKEDELKVAIYSYNDLLISFSQTITE